MWCFIYLIPRGDLPIEDALVLVQAEFPGAHKIFASCADDVVAVVPAQIDASTAQTLAQNGDVLRDSSVLAYVPPGSEQDLMRSYRRRAEHHAKMRAAEESNDLSIDPAELNELLDAQKKLSALEAAGVDNWQGYGIAMKSLSASDQE